MSWDERYSTAEYVYGTEPNGFLVEHAGLLRGPVLSLAEGEGRNGVFLAGQGLTVHGVDSSAVGLAKAQALAAARGVSLHVEQADLAEFVPACAAYGAVVSIFAHVPGAVRTRLYPLLVDCLQPGGLLLLEAYSLAQLMSVDAIRCGFAGLEPVLLQELTREVHEGRLHTGLASVVQFIGRKPC